MACAAIVRVASCRPVHLGAVLCGRPLAACALRYITIEWIAFVATRPNGVNAVTTPN